jgi:hypothetical protein
MTRGKNNKVTSAKDTLPDIELLKQLCEIHAPSGAETPLKNFLLHYFKSKKTSWKHTFQIIEGEEFQDC